jgi:hypothetical protein
LSSAILYLAIVAIWAGVLIPRWLKRDTTQAAKSPADGVPVASADGVPVASADGVPVASADAGRDGRTHGADGDMTESDADADAGPVMADGDELDDAREYQPPDQHQADPSENRARMLSARRRMLLILCTLTVAALGIAVLGLAAWWVTAPPILMLGGYIMLLREARRADAEHALMREAARQDEQERLAALAAREAREAEAARKAAAAASENAHVIHISERVRDELYDQYADEDRRAVGD